MKNLHLLTAAISTLALSIAGSGIARAQDSDATDQIIQTTAKQAIVYDYTTGQTLFEKNADEKMPTSSMSKGMTVYALFDALKKGEVTLEDTFDVSEKAWRKGGSKMFVSVGEKVKIEDLIRGILVQSGNDATIVVAEGLAGTEADFADAITAKAHELGMENTNFTNASGWPDPDHYSTTRDLSIMAKNIIQNFPDYYPYFSEKEFTYNNITQRNRNPLIYRDMGADGLKTGHTEDGGYGLIGSGANKDRRVIIVVNGIATESDRAQEAARLLDWGLRRFVLKTLFEGNTPLAKPPVIYGKSKTIPVGLKEDLQLSIPRMGAKNVEAITEFATPIKAPVKTGDQLGTVKITIPGQHPTTYPLYALSDVEESNIISKTIEKLKSLVTGQ
jgi:D-alanyl-D-alanine carboxypeptidase (penicillin-binding protein 5/6)